MASKLGTILSLIFFAIAMFIGVDVLRLQFIHTSLDAFAISLGEQIAIKGKVTSEMQEMASEKYGAELYQITKSAMVGEFLEYGLSVEYTPVFISKEVMTITVTRMVLIGYMD